MPHPSISATAPAIEASGLAKRFGEVTAVLDVDLRVERGSILGLLGPNGAGKTTTVRILSTLTRPDAGTARIAGLDVVRDAHGVRRLIGVTGQDVSVDRDLTGIENLVLVGRLAGLSRAEARSRARDLIELVGLTDAAPRPARTYSGGMRRRLDLAATLVHRPEVVFLDEPTTGLDPARRQDTWALVRSLSDQGTTVLLTTQYLEEADHLADEIVVIDAGRVAAQGSPDSLKRRLGRQTLDVRVSEPDRLDDAAALVSRLLEEAPAVDRPTGRLRARISEAEAMPAIARAMDDADIGLDEFALRLPSLDDVFLSLTGHRADPPAPEEAAR